MVAGNRIVDISEDAVAVRRRRRRALFRIGVPILGIALVIVAILAIALYSDSANRRGVLALSDEFLNTLDARIAQRVAAFLEPCERSLRIMRDIAVHIPAAERRDTAERFAVSVLKESPQIAAFYVGDNAGDFLMVRRDGDGVQTKQITNGSAGRQVILTERDVAGVETRRWEDPTDSFDPRTRPWFKGALGTDDLYWTGVYTFFSDRKPGVTASTRVPDVNGADRVLGVDVTLEELSRFLASLQIGTHGRSLIMDDQGRVIAVSDSERTIQPAGTQFVPPKVDALNDAILTAAFDRFRVEGQGRRIIEHDGVRYISSATLIPGAAHKWWILIVVPENDFIGFVASNNRTALIMSLSIVLAVVVLAVLLVRQGLRSDRSVRLMTERGRLMSQQSAAYAAISKETAQGTSEAPQALTEGLIAVTGAWRASAWRLTAGNQILRCPDSYERDSQGHTGGFELHRRELPAFFELLESGDELSIPDAATDRRTVQFHKIIMQSLGSHALTVIPIRHGEQVIGAICLEDPRTLEGTKDFLRTVCSMFSSTIKIEPQDVSQPAEGAPVPAAQHQPQTAPSVSPILSADLGPSAADHAHLRAEYFPALSVMVLHLSGSLALAKKTGAGDTGMAVQIAELLQEVAAEHGVTYLKFVGQEAIAAAGFEKHDEEAMTRIAAAAVAIRDHLSRMVETGGLGSEFRIGLGFGAGYGCLVGRERQQFNLWGEALETANMMAHSAAPGAIQATAAAYTRLRQDFLFRPRGSFYLPGIGQSHTFVLAGQL
jgi:class 3 adenylate cyclase